MVGEKIRYYRQKMGYTQEEVASRLHVTRQTLSKWEKNLSVPDADLLVHLAEILGTDTNVLLGISSPAEQETVPLTENAVAQQLANIAEQMAVRNRRAKRVWKSLGIIAAAVLFFTLLGCILLSVTETEPVQGPVEIVSFEEGHVSE